MKRFLQNSISFILILAVVVSLIYAGIEYWSPDKSRSKSGVYLFGDSQLCQDFDLPYFSAGSHEDVISYAHHGAGVYDMIFFANAVPSQSVCIVAFSECALYRDPLTDYNRSGLSVRSLRDMYLSGCPIDECMRIANLNRNIIYTLCTDNTYPLFPYSPEIVYTQPLSIFCDIFNRRSEYAIWKQEAYKKAINILYQKQCRLVIVSFPFEQQVEECATNSINRLAADSLRDELCRMYDINMIDIVLENDSSLMYDLSHFNEIGAHMATTAIIDRIGSSNENLFIKFQNPAR